MDEALVNGWKYENDAEYFPLAKKPDVTDDLKGTNTALNTWERGQRQFGWRRSGGTRAHAGCDLYGKEGDAVFAIKAGVVSRSDDNFYGGTGVIEIDHCDYTIRYGEILVGSRLVKKGDRVKAGQKIAEMGHCNDVKNAMLHLEQYSNICTGLLTSNENPNFKDQESNLPYQRRLDLLDPTPLLNELIKKPLPTEEKEKNK
jgi:murein DD-endopeptidase MepM/ murein hydrolase activator NlpD